jgi:hypothetical protein
MAAIFSSSELFCPFFIVSFFARWAGIIVKEQRTSALLFPTEDFFRDDYLHDQLGLIYLPQRTHNFPWAKAWSLVREPDAGNPPVRFDERDVETEHDRDIEAPATKRVGNR